MSTGWARVAIVVGVGALMGVSACQVLTKRYAKDNPPAPVPATVESVTGAVLHVVMEGSVGVGSDQPATQGMAIREGSQFKVPHEGRIRIRTKLGSLLEVSAVGFTDGFARITRLVPAGDYVAFDVYDGRVSIAAVPGQSWEINVDSTRKRGSTSTATKGTGGLVSGEYGVHGDQFRLVVKDGTASVQESGLTTAWRTVPAGQMYTSTTVTDQQGAIEPAAPDPLGDLNLLSKAQQKAP